MSLISLTNSTEEAIVDAADYKYLSQWQWKSCAGYAGRHVGNNQKGTGRIVFMHRVVNNTSEDKITDHINGNKLDNRRSNLRTATPTINQRNRTINKNNKSGVSGVWYNPKHGSAGAWVANKRAGGKTVTKRWGCLKRGYDEAKRLAIEWRRQHELAYNITTRKRG